jgi:5-hydroxyisourate hydrolase
MARISTHVLDTARGVAAQGVRVELHIVRASGRELVTGAVTDADGRTTEPLITGEQLESGVYELTFHVADYFRRAGHALSDPPFLDVVTVRVGIADPGGHYHVPLLVAPYGYSTYRGT